MFDRFTDRSRTVMGLARQEAQRLRHDSIGTGHILLGLLAETSGVASNVLQNLGVDLAAVRVQVEALVRPGGATVTMGQLPFTPRAKQVLEYTLEEEVQLRHNYIGTEHLLLGLLRVSEGTGAQALTALGVSADTIRDEVLGLLAGEGRRSEGKLPGGPERWVGSFFHRDTDRTRTVMWLALQEALRLRGTSVGTEHLLLGLVGEERGVAANILKNLGVDLQALRGEIEKRVVPSDAGLAVGLPFSAGLKELLQLAVDEASQLGHDYTGTEHLLLALLRVGDGVAADAIAALGLPREKLRDDVLSLLGFPPSAAPPP